MGCVWQINFFYLVSVFFGVIFIVINGMTVILLAEVSFFKSLCMYKVIHFSSRAVFN